MKKKTFDKIKFWKVDIFLSGKSMAYTTCINIRDLVYYFETQIFDFYEMNPNIPKWNLITTLNDYLSDIFIYKSYTGLVPYWIFPLFWKPLDFGNADIVSFKQLKMLGFY